MARIQLKDFMETSTSEHKAFLRKKKSPTSRFGSPTKEIKALDSFPADSQRIPTLVTSGLADNIPVSPQQHNAAIHDEI
jgi:hypothetical protein